MSHFTAHLTVNLAQWIQWLRGRMGTEAEKVPKVKEQNHRATSRPGRKGCKVLM